MFEYEQNFKVCESCHKPEHAKKSCFSHTQKSVDSKVMWKGTHRRGRSRSAMGKKKNTRGKSTGQIPNKVILDLL